MSNPHKFCHSSGSDARIVEGKVAGSDVRIVEGEVAELKTIG